jgi:hypothetical protein
MDTESKPSTDFTVQSLIADHQDDMRRLAMSFAKDVAWRIEDREVYADDFQQVIQEAMWAALKKCGYPEK